MKLEFSRQNFEKYSNIKFHKNPSSGNRVVRHFANVHNQTGYTVSKRWTVFSFLPFSVHYRRVFATRRKIEFPVFEKIDVHIYFHAHTRTCFAEVLAGGGFAAQRTIRSNLFNFNLLLNPWIPFGKAVPLEACTGPEGSRKLRLPDFKTIGTWRW
jgi:hypothetical protein